ncbi:hypothetical protein MJG53_009393 [Ovis ammon polii x Ovis aries]|uniref:Uncharacterized protein n=1 Tax=Ovis ammon polii x Ovis aries TaxID=2918886 RepID=A0ACB9UWH9_9CETA|nr:hypothetical protein MJG53_009393 [Ovis ammon polii x Ovis aries]
MKDLIGTVSRSHVCIPSVRNSVQLTAGRAFLEEHIQGFVQGLTEVTCVKDDTETKEGLSLLESLGGSPRHCYLIQSSRQPRKNWFGNTRLLSLSDKLLFYNDALNQLILVTCTRRVAVMILDENLQPLKFHKEGSEGKASDNLKHTDPYGVIRSATHQPFPGSHRMQRQKEPDEAQGNEIPAELALWSPGSKLPSPLTPSKPYQKKEDDVSVETPGTHYVGGKPHGRHFLSFLEETIPC